MVQLNYGTAAKFIEMGGAIQKGCKVTWINSVKNKITSVTYKCNNTYITKAADIVLSSMPLKDLITSMGEAVPEKILNVAKGLPYRDFVTIGLLVKNLNLINETKLKTLGYIVPDCKVVMPMAIQLMHQWINGSIILQSSSHIGFACSV